MVNKNTDSLTLDVKFKVKDVLRYNISVALKSIANIVALGLGLIVIIYFFYKMSTRTVGLDIFISQNIIWLIIPALIFMLIPWRVWQITLSQMQMKNFAYGVTYVFSKDSIILDLGDDKDEVKWDIFVKIIETKYDFRFYVNNISAQIIPKHNLSKEDIVAFRAIIKQAVDNTVYKLK